MKELNLTAAKRDGTGKGINRRLRQTGEIPAIVYGPETTPIPVKLSYKNLYRALHGAPLSNIINLTIEGDDKPMRKVLIREIQKNPVTGELVHLDFHHIAMDRPITLTVPVETVGLPIGVKNFGGIVEHIRRDIEISCLPTHIPELIQIDISELNIGASLHVANLKVENVTILTDPGQTLVTVVAPTVIKAAAAEEVAAVAEGEEGAEGEAKAEGEEGKEGEEGEDKDKDKEKERGKKGKEDREK
jgi:large subunit ribosomal protein L25